MERAAVLRLLESVRSGELAPDAALERLRYLPFEDLGFARVDHHRALRRGQPEVVFCPGKQPEQVAAILSRLAAQNPVVLATRATEAQYEAVQRACPAATYDPVSRLIRIGDPKAAPAAHAGSVSLVAAGTSDLAVAEEAGGTLEAFGHTVTRVYDVGVAGLHRLLGNLDAILRADVVVVVAGMEGALPSVVGGLIEQPMIAVPTSIGYGANFGGLSALLTMLNSCAAGITVVNIDNGFGAARAADSILRYGHRARTKGR